MLACDFRNIRIGSLAQIGQKIVKAFAIFDQTSRSNFRLLAVEPCAKEFAHRLNHYVLASNLCMESGNDPSCLECRSLAPRCLLIGGSQLLCLLPVLRAR